MIVNRHRSKQTNLGFVHQIVFQILSASQVSSKNFQLQVRDMRARNYLLNVNWESFFFFQSLINLRPNFRFADELKNTHNQWQLNMAMISARVSDDRNAFQPLESTWN